MNNNFDYTIPAAGSRNVKVLDWQFVPEVRNLIEDTDEHGNNRPHVIDSSRPADDIITKAHVLINLKSSDDEILETRLYGGRIAYFMSCIVRQTEGAVMGMKTSQVLDYLRTHEFTVWVSYSTMYGIQFDYRAPIK